VSAPISEHDVGKAFRTFAELIFDWVDFTPRREDVDQTISRIQGNEALLASRLKGLRDTSPPEELRATEDLRRKVANESLLREQLEVERRKYEEDTEKLQQAGPAICRCAVQNGIDPTPLKRLIELRDVTAAHDAWLVLSNLLDALGAATPSVKAAKMEQSTRPLIPSTAPAHTASPLHEVYDLVADAVSVACGLREEMAKSEHEVEDFQAAALALADARGDAEEALRESEIWLRAHALSVWEACRAALDGIELVNHACFHVLTTNGVNVRGHLGGGFRPCSQPMACTGRFRGDIQAYFVALPPVDEHALLEHLRHETITASDRLSIASAPASPVLTGSGQKEVPPANNTTRTPRGTVNQRMLERLQHEPESVDWSQREWAEQLHCAPSAIADALAWKTVMKTRAMAAVDRFDRPR
jgi:hypothetical protein